MCDYVPLCYKRPKHKKKQCTKCCRGPRGLRGLTGPTGTVAPDPTLPRVLKVQLESGVPVPTFLEGFSWENDVPEPPSWPVAGAFTFYKATMLDLESYPLSELYTVNGAISHTDTNMLHSVVIAHYTTNDGVLTLLDFHQASSQTPGTIDTLLAQTLQNAVATDCFYFAISPDQMDLTNFNYNLGSLKQHKTFFFPSQLPLPNPNGTMVPVGFSVAKVTCAFSLFIQISGAQGGGGAGQSSSNTGGTTSIGRGGGGGGGGGAFGNGCTPGVCVPLSLVPGDVIEMFVGHGGAGGSAQPGTNPNGTDGQASFIRLNGNLLGGTASETGGFIGFNPVEGGTRGFGGTGRGTGGTGIFSGTFGNAGGGGGGGSGLINGVPTPPGAGGFFGGQDGGTNPRDGGNGGIGSAQFIGAGGKGGGSTAPSALVGSGGGGGAGGAGPSPRGGGGGNGGLSGQPGETPPIGGGGGGSGGLGADGTTILGGNGANGFSGGFMLS